MPSENNNPAVNEDGTKQAKKNRRNTNEIHSAIDELIAACHTYKYIPIVMRKLKIGSITNFYELYGKAIIEQAEPIPILKAYPLWSSEFKREIEKKLNHNKDSFYVIEENDEHSIIIRKIDGDYDSGL